MTRTIFTWLAALLLTLAFSPRGGAADIPPPFKLRWGETATRMEQLLKGVKATVVQRRTVEGREVWEVDGLKQQGQKRTVFYFQQSQLVEVELQFQRDDWDEPKYDSYMGDMRRKLEELYGPGQLISRKKEPEGDVTQTLVGWKWSQNNTAVELIYFAAQGPVHVFRTLSVHFKTY